MYLKPCNLFFIYFLIEFHLAFMWEWKVKDNNRSNEKKFRQKYLWARDDVDVTNLVCHWELISFIIGYQSSFFFFHMWRSSWAVTPPGLATGWCVRIETTKTTRCGIVCWGTLYLSIFQHTRTAPLAAGHLSEWRVKPVPSIRGHIQGGI